MVKLLDFLSSTKIIIACFMLMVIIGFSFSFAQRLVGGDLLDIQMNAVDASARLAEMNSWHKSNHIWITIIVDSLYPLAYGGLLIGIVAKFASSWRKLAVIPAFTAVIADFAENLVQVIALSGFENILALKNVITPLKFGSVLIAALLAVIIMLIACFKWMQKKRD